MSDMDEDVIYYNTVDNDRFLVKVTGENQGHGRLVVKVVESGEVLLDEHVGLMFGAVFGPDVSDVQLWEESAIVAIDAYIERTNG